MDHKWIVIIFAVTAHTQLVLAFFPSYWDPVRRLGRRFTTLAVPFLVPALLGLLLAVQLIDRWQGLSDPVRIAGALGIGACSATLAMNAARLRRLRTDAN